jgi:hypothetical protein
MTLGFLRNLLLVSVFFNCSSKELKQTSHISESGISLTQDELATEAERDIFPELKSEDFEVTPELYTVRFSVKSPYESDSVESEITAHLDTAGVGKISKITVNYSQNRYEIPYLDYPVFKLQELVNMKNYPPVRFIDYNFDGFPDVAIHNRVASGTKNQMYDTYLFRHDRNGYYKDQFLSQLTNPTLDKEERTLTTFGAGGMGSQIYSLAIYRWTEDNYVLTRSERQTYVDSIDRYIRTTKQLADTTWSTEVDTLRDDQLMR